MKNVMVCKLSDTDSFSINNAMDVNLNDSMVYHYTLRDMATKKSLTTTPKNFKTEALDLFYLAMMVFYADKKVLRADFPDGWTREMEIYMPVHHPEKWRILNNKLEQALNFLTGDKWHFHYRFRGYTCNECKYIKKRWKERNSIKFQDTDTISMLSGGLDSFIGAIDLLNQKKNPIFVGIYSGGKGVQGPQERVIDVLESHFELPKDRFHRFYASPICCRESTTRSRSLLFFSHAILLASAMGHHVNLCIPENGFISLNVPLTIHRIGSLSTRTTHPYYIGLLQQIIEMLGIPVRIYNPYQFVTKGEMVAQCSDKSFLRKNIELTMSCSRPDFARWKGSSFPSHCGTCIPCIIRKAALMKARYKDRTIYRNNWTGREAKANLLSYRLGLRDFKDPWLAVQLNGKITTDIEKYVRVYEEGMNELRKLIDTL